MHLDEFCIGITYKSVLCFLALFSSFLRSWYQGTFDTISLVILIFVGSTFFCVVDNFITTYVIIKCLIFITFSVFNSCSIILLLFLELGSVEDKCFIKNCLSLRYSVTLRCQLLCTTHTACIIDKSKICLNLVPHLIYITNCRLLNWPVKKEKPNLT